MIYVYVVIVLTDTDKFVNLKTFKTSQLAHKYAVSIKELRAVVYKEKVNKELE